jgi:hypothetical protein
MNCYWFHGVYKARENVLRLLRFLEYWSGVAEGPGGRPLEEALRLSR